VKFISLSFSISCQQLFKEGKGSGVFSCREACSGVGCSIMKLGVARREATGLRGDTAPREWPKGT
jgi:hypothetical protein